MDPREIVQLVEVGFELAGVAALIVGTVVSVAMFTAALLRGDVRSQAYLDLRRGVGRAILIGLEFLVAADIIRSVAIEPTLQSVAILGLIVLVRTFLSWSLEVEISGSWPWRRARADTGKGAVDEETAL